jgi:hypothetical protein
MGRKEGVGFKWDRGGELGGSDVELAAMNIIDCSRWYRTGRRQALQVTGWPVSAWLLLSLDRASWILVVKLWAASGYERRVDMVHRAVFTNADGVV